MVFEIEMKITIMGAPVIDSDRKWQWQLLTVAYYRDTVSDVGAAAWVRGPRGRCFLPSPGAEEALVSRSRKVKKQYRRH